MNIRFGLFWLLTALIACKDEAGVFIPDTTGISVSCEIIRFDSILASIDTNKIEPAVRELNEQYPNFFSLYVKNIVPLYDTSELRFLQNFKEYLQDGVTQKVLDTVGIEYPDMNDLNTQFTDAFKNIKYYFPDWVEPRLYTLTSNFGYQNFIFDDVASDGIGIGLDMFLGASFPYKSIDPQNPGFSDYLTRSFNRHHIVKKVCNLMVDEINNQSPGVRLLDQMVHQGVGLYLLKRFLPTTHDTIIHEYSKKQLDWCEANQLEMWNFFIEQDLLYETNPQKIIKYISPSPNSPQMPESAPGRTGAYIGYKMVEAYVQKYPETRLSDLLTITDSQAFMEKARFRPKNR